MDHLPHGFLLPGPSCNLQGSEELFITLQKFSKWTMDSCNIVFFAYFTHRLKPSPSVLFTIPHSQQSGHMEKKADFSQQPCKGVLKSPIWFSTSILTRLWESGISNHNHNINHILTDPRCSSVQNLLCLCNISLELFNFILQVQVLLPKDSAAPFDTLWM